MIQIWCYALDSRPRKKAGRRAWLLQHRRKRPFDFWARGRQPVHPAPPTSENILIPYSLLDRSLQTAPHAHFQERIRSVPGRASRTPRSHRFILPSLSSLRAGVGEIRSAHLFYKGFVHAFSIVY